MSAPPVPTRRLATLLALRLLMWLLVCAVTAKVNAPRAPTGSPWPLAQPVLALLLLGLSLAAAYALWLRSGRRLRALAWSQLVLDQLLYTLVVYLTGGPLSAATSLYGLTCVVAATLLGPLASVAAGVLGVGLYVALCGAMLSGALPPTAQQQALLASTLGQPSAALYPALVQSAGVLAVAALAAWLAGRLIATGGALVAAEARADRAEQLALLGRLAAGLAHEIRNPLSSISASAEMLSEAPSLSDDERMLCDIVTRETKRLNDLVSDMMNLARPRPPQPVPHDVQRTAREVIELARQLGRSSAGDVEVCVVEPSTHAPDAVFDPDQLRQVLWNLVKNAVEASAAGQRVELRLEHDARQVRLLVRDHGAGLSQEERARVFDAFFTTRTRGTGLGLAVVQRIVQEHEAHGATLSVGDTPGGGTTFTLALAAHERRRDLPAGDPALPI